MAIPYPPGYPFQPYGPFYTQPRPSFLYPQGMYPQYLHYGPYAPYVPASGFASFDEASPTWLPSSFVPYSQTYPIYTGTPGTEMPGEPGAFSYQLDDTRQSDSQQVGNSYRQVQRPTPTHKGGSERLQERPPHTEHIDLSAMFPKEVFLNGPTDQKRAALTFDDGPDDVWTPQILDVLKQYNVKATFFVVGQRCAAHPQVLQRIIREGHIVGNHTYDHPNLTKITPEERKTEIERTERIIDQIAKVKTRLFRPPYGALTPDIVREISSMDYVIIYWNVDSLDWAGLNGPQIAANVLAHVHRGSIILQHCAGGHGENLSGTIAALPYLISVLKREGLEPVTVPELLKINPYR